MMIFCASLMRTHILMFDEYEAESLDSESDVHRNLPCKKL